MEEIDPSTTRSSASRATSSGGRSHPRLVDESNTIRLIDVAFVGKDEDGNVLAFELTELDPDVQESLDTLGIEVQGLLNEDDLQDAAGCARAELLRGGARLGERVGADRDAGDARRGRRPPRIRAVPHEVVQAAREWVVEQAKA